MERLRAANDYFQLTLALIENRRQRQRQKRFIVHGVKAVDEAIGNGWSFESVWVPEGRTLSSWAHEVLDRAAPRRTLATRPELFAALADKDEPGELIAVVDLPRSRLDQARVVATGLTVICDRPTSPGNLGSIIRSADAFGAGAVIVTGHAADIYDPRTVRASVGTLFAIPVEHIASPEDAVRWLRATDPRIRLAGTSARAELVVEDYDLRPPVALVFGGETKGLSRWWIEAADALLTIPIAGAASSLNLAAAATAFLNEARRQRRAPPA